jgi:16S rRNA (uracil1498-N3)-methyltransferase
VRARRAVHTEPHRSLTLYQCLLKGDRFEWVLQKGTELGVSRFVPVLSQRTVLRDPLRVEKKRPRWEQIIREAAEQSHRGHLARLAPPLAFPEACEQGAAAHDLALIPWEEATEPGLLSLLSGLPSPVQRVALVIGPEGGFTRAEVDAAQRHGLQVVTLGPRVLRSETASVAALAIVLSALGEMGGANQA